jgi:small-conductance mechanosensitive channel
MSFLEWTFYNNSIKIWVFALLIGAFSWILLRILLKFVVKQFKMFAQKTKTQLDDAIVFIFEKTKSFLFFFISVYFATIVLTLPPFVTKFTINILVIAFLIQTAIWGNSLISFYIKHYTEKKIEKDSSVVTTISALGFIGRVTLFSALLLLALDNLGFNVTALIAGLGVGGIAIALAVQNILGDLFASLSIVLDKPFVVSDFIIVGEFLGTVEHIGLKTTKIRSLSGEQLVFSNNDLLQSRIRNYKRMYERRVVFSIGVVYQTSYEQLKKIPKIIQEIIESQENVRFDRAHFKEYANFSLNFETVYWIKSPDYNVYMDIHQAINLAIYQSFKEEGIEFAYPTQTLYLDK